MPPTAYHFPPNNNPLSQSWHLQSEYDNGNEDSYTFWYILLSKFAHLVSYKKNPVQLDKRSATDNIGHYETFRFFLQLEVVLKHIQLHAHLSPEYSHYL